MSAVQRERVRSARRRLVASSCTGVLSLIGAVYAADLLASAASASGFTSYASLALSDSVVVAHSGTAFFYTLLESLPAPESIATLALIAILIQSLRVFVGARTLRASFA